MIEMLGIRQRDLLKLLLRNKGGMTVDALVQSLGVTRNAVRQHLAVLEEEQLVTKSTTRPTGGRPEHLYVLTQKGSEIFPRQYSWFAQMLVDMVLHEVGEDGMNERLAAAGVRIAQQLTGNAVTSLPIEAKVEKLAQVMEELGYDVNPLAKGSEKHIPIIEANNCVFHDLAKANPQVCSFDVALISTFTGSQVQHEECMAKGGHVCRFRLT
jgi:predicted ArsR family transcriptional regulator